MENRDEILNLDDTALSSRCELTFFKGTGNGGQKRNKTSSAARVRLIGSEYSAEDCTERSQHRNRAAALRKLRLTIAYHERVTPPPPLPRSECAQEHADYPLWLARLLDQLDAAGYDHRTAAESTGFSPTSMLKKLARDPQLWQFVQTHREQNNLPPLRKP